MADRCLTWFIPKLLSNNVQGEDVSTPYVLDADYVPVRVVLRQKVAQGGEATVIDINDDGVSIFPSTALQPAINQGLLASEWDMFLETLTVMEKDSVVTLDVDQVSGTVPGEHLMVQLELDRA